MYGTTITRAMRQGATSTGRPEGGYKQSAIKGIVPGDISIEKEDRYFRAGNADDNIAPGADGHLSALDRHLAGGIRQR
jgi:hypothetical protein